MPEGPVYSDWPVRLDEHVVNAKELSSHRTVQEPFAL